MNKLLFLIKKPPVIATLGRFYSGLLDKKKFLIFETNFKELGKINFFIKKSKKTILAIERIKTKEEILEIKKTLKILPASAFLVLNFDDDRTRGLKNFNNCLTYGFFKKADLRATDLSIDFKGANLKINYQGNIVPFWIKGLFQKEELYGYLAAIGAGLILGLNLVEMSQKIKSR